MRPSREARALEGRRRSQRNYVNRRGLRTDRGWGHGIRLNKFNYMVGLHLGRWGSFWTSIHTKRRAACSTDIPTTMVGRIEAMEKRLDAMLQAVKSMRPAFQAFYATLSDEQKASLNTDVNRREGQIAASIGTKLLKGIVKEQSQWGHDRR
jgi:hypothetical protein